MGPQPVRRRLLDDALAVGHAVELARQAVTLHREGPVRGDPLLQGRTFHALEKVLKAVHLELGQAEHDPLAHAAVEVGPGDVLGGAPEIHPPVHHLHLVHAEAAQLLAHQSLQPEQAGNAQRIDLHRIASK